MPLNPPTLEELLADAISNQAHLVFAGRSHAQACLRKLTEHGYRIVSVEEGEVERAGAAMMRAIAGRKLAREFTDDEIRDFARAAIAALSASRASEPPADLPHRILAFLGRLCNVDQCFEAMSIAAELGEDVEAVEIAANGMLGYRGSLDDSLEAAENGADKRYYRITLRGELRLKEMGGADGEARNAALEILNGIKWRSADRDNMEFTATITYSQMDAIRALKSTPKEQQLFSEGYFSDRVKAGERPPKEQP